jgi:glutamate-1-semialdehyde 2,1-aminomutase
MAASIAVGEAVTEALTAAGVPHRVQRAATLFSVMFGEHAAEHGSHNYADTLANDTFRYGPFFHAMLEQGISLPPSVFEAWFVSAAHDDAVINRIIEALPAAARTAAAATR